MTHQTCGQRFFEGFLLFLLSHCLVSFEVSLILEHDRCGCLYVSYWVMRNLTRAFWKSLITSTVSSMSASSKVEAPARPHSCARNLAMAMDWETVAPCHSSTGSWPYGRDGFRVFMSSAHVEIDIRCILCYVDMSTYPLTLTINNQSNTPYRQWFSCLHTSCRHAPGSAGRSRPSPWRCSVLAWSLSLSRCGTSPSTDTVQLCGWVTIDCTHPARSGTAPPAPVKCPLCTP